MLLYASFYWRLRHQADTPIQASIAVPTKGSMPAYLSERLQLAGCALPLFEAPAIEVLFQASQGLPGKINRAAHYALSAAALAKLRQINTEHVQAALDEVQ